VRVKERTYALNFAIYCASGKMDAETDGDIWHSDPERIPLDNLRDNDLETAGWRVLRFSSHHIHEAMADYCVPTIVENVNRLGGVDKGALVPRRISLDAPDGFQQLPLFDAVTGSLKDGATNE